jgi:transcriptional regulator with XRE-family HTH domain
MPQLDASNHPELVRFGEKVREYRKKRALSQEELAALAELDRAYMGGIERGERNLGLLNVVRVAKALGVSVSQLCEGIDR